MTMPTVTLRSLVGTRETKVGTFLFEFATSGIGQILKAAGADFAVDLGSQGNVTLAVTLSNWDEAVSIEAPPADQVQS